MKTPALPLVLSLASLMLLSACDSISPRLGSRPTPPPQRTPYRAPVPGMWIRSASDASKLGYEYGRYDRLHWYFSNPHRYRHHIRIPANYYHAYKDGYKAGYREAR
jgi:hypothetical protein